VIALMEIFHRISLNSRLDADFLAVLDSFQVKYKARDLPEGPGGKSQFIYLDIAETDKNWGNIQKHIRSAGVLDRYETFFTEDEILNAEWVRLIPTFEHEYPQPQKTWVTHPENYSDHCHNCGKHLQVAPYKIQYEPKMGENDFMTLIWGRKIFCTMRVIETIRDNLINGFTAWEVIINQFNVPAHTIAQLYAQNTSKQGLLGGNALKPEVCTVCHQKKYFSHQKGVMVYKRTAINPNVDILQTYEWFGKGRKSAYKEILISNRFARLIIENKWKGVRMKVIELE
jgi:hypothetical protein